MSAYSLARERACPSPSRQRRSASAHRPAVTASRIRSDNRTPQVAGSPDVMCEPSVDRERAGQEASRPVLSQPHAQAYAGPSREHDGRTGAVPLGSARVTHDVGDRADSGSRRVAGKRQARLRAGHVEHPVRLVGRHPIERSIGAILNSRSEGCQRGTGLNHATWATGARRTR